MDPLKSLHPNNKRLPPPLINIPPGVFITWGKLVLADGQNTTRGPFSGGPRSGSGSRFGSRFICKILIYIYMY